MQQHQETQRDNRRNMPEYECSHCHKTMEFPVSPCPHCGASLSKVRCIPCGFRDRRQVFIDNDHRCPKCGESVDIEETEDEPELIEVEPKEKAAHSPPVGKTAATHPSPLPQEAPDVEAPLTEKQSSELSEQQQQDIVLTPAPIGRRIVAFLVDVVVLSLAWPVISLIPLMVLKFLVGEDLLPLVEVPAIIIFIWIYFATMESSRIQATVGKLVTKLKVTRDDGKKLSFFRSFLRNFSKAFSTGIMGIGYLMILFTRKKQGLHDLMSRSLVSLRDPGATGRGRIVYQRVPESET